MGGDVQTRAGFGAGNQFDAPFRPRCIRAERLCKRVLWVRLLSGHGFTCVTRQRGTQSVLKNGPDEGQVIRRDLRNSTQLRRVSKAELPRPPRPARFTSKYPARIGRVICCEEQFKVRMTAVAS